ncbi:MAG: glyceraldehyde 3-phosphate dehydrogenase NAD-binding domain-containing protein [Zoogloea sp.]|uniref:type I glyceraldehyde-3-phosphate dehydrogenase n=1 Tax=Zoogloea sp. TaxID=49181 RepID=UPI00262166E2|nr:glyceraldehyde 3-phosphate dehydrogenase NAD-binding domain-containing protein [Zoogloea sp.]MDD2991060.1 glyceraldehyde 3-phosphate dehydrogenase NAD-binding domain-containing protein [Zoogloea sp.]
MTLKIAINGYGRIGRCFLRALLASPVRSNFRIVAINEPADLESMAYLTRFDSTHGCFPGQVDVLGDGLCIDGQPIRVFHADTPEGVDWAALEVDVLIEASGRYSHRHELQRFLTAGCKRLLLSHPGQTAQDVDRTVVYGMNHELLDGRESIVSAASCTTNAIVPVLALLEQAFGIEQAMLTTLHSVMNDQPLIDGYHHTDLHRTRSAMQSMIPVATGLARGVQRLLPELTGRIESKAIRVPVVNVSAIDLVATLKCSTTVGEVRSLVKGVVEGRESGRMAYTDDPHASIDFNHSFHSAIVDGGQTRMSGDRLLNLLVWFDNEWGFANRMIDVLAYWGKRMS